MAAVLPTVAAVALALLSAPDDAPTYDIDVAEISGAPDACPSQDLVAESLAARMPGVVARPGHEPGPNTLRLGLTVGDDGVAHVTMTDSTGALRLERDLELPKGSGATGGANGGPGAHPRPAPHDRSGGCAALADTIALIVERYMRHIGYHEPPPPVLVQPAPPPPPPVAPPPPEEAGPGVRLGVGFAARLPVNAPWRFEPELLAAVSLGPLELSLSAGFGLPREQPVPATAPATSGTFTWMTVPVRASAGWALPVGRRLVVAPALGAGVDLVLASTSGIGATRRSSALEPVLEGGVSATLQLTRRVWIGLRAFQGIDLRPEEFVVSTGGNPAEQRLFMTPRAYTRLGLDFGISLGKIRGLP
jgi:hypothetical protein